jgi:hypothetical protein
LFLSFSLSLCLYDIYDDDDGLTTSLLFFSLSLYLVRVEWI